MMTVCFEGFVECVRCGCKMQCRKRTANYREALANFLLKNVP